MCVGVVIVGTVTVACADEPRAVVSITPASAADGGDRDAGSTGVVDAGSIVDAPPPVWCVPLEAVNPSTVCSKECAKTPATVFYPRENCLHGVEVFGCATCRNGPGCGGATEGCCFVNGKDGRIISTYDCNSFLATSGWRLCDPSEIETVKGSASCQ